MDRKEKMKHLMILATLFLASCFHDSGDGDDLFEETESGATGNSGGDSDGDGGASDTADDAGAETGGGTGGVGSEGSEETSGGGSTGGGDTDTSEPGDGGSTATDSTGAGTMDTTDDLTSSGETSTPSDSTACAQGSEGCQCFPNDTCLNNELACEAGICTACVAGMTRCNGICKNTQTDDLNCGGCGNACSIVDNVGHCAAGKCGPVWSECHSGGTCAAWCSGGSTCSAGCGAAVKSFNSWGECEALTGGYNLAAACGASLGTNIIRCCCEQ